TTGDIKISVLVDKADGVRALRAVHQAFRLHEPRPGESAGRAAKPGPTPARRLPAGAVEESPGRDVGSAIVQRLSSMDAIVGRDVLLSTDQGRITIFGLPDRPGNCSRVFQAVAQGGIVVDMIVQNPTGPGRAELSFSVPLKDLDRSYRLTEEAV